MFFFIDCPYSQCWYSGRFMYSAVYYSLFAGYPYNECFNARPYKEPLVYHCEEGCPDAPMDYEEYCKENKIKYRRVIDSYVEVTRYYGNHTHKDVRCEGHNGNIIVPLCNSLRGRNSRRIGLLSELKKFLESPVCREDDMMNTYITRLENAEKQHFINKIYPFIEDGSGRPCLYEKNLRLGMIQVRIDTISDDNFYTYNTNHRVLCNNRVVDSTEYSLNYNSIEWNVSTRNELAFRRLNYDQEDDDYPESDPAENPDD